MSAPNSPPASGLHRTSSSLASSSQHIILAHKAVLKRDAVRARKKKPKTRTGCLTCKSYTFRHAETVANGAADFVGLSVMQGNHTVSDASNLVLTVRDMLLT
jgi:hypothetical protein